MSVKEKLAGLWTWIKGLFTDAKDRPEIKAVLGFVTVIVAFVWLFLKADIGGFATIFGLGLGLLGIKTVEDSRIDAKKGD